eukprot:1355946-Pyramimonas_sp.AAC.1
MREEPVGICCVCAQWEALLTGAMVRAANGRGACGFMLRVCPTGEEPVGICCVCNSRPSRS